MLRVLSFLQNRPEDHCWAHPIDGVVAYVALTEKRVVELIDRWEPHIVALQEVDSRRDKHAGINPFEFLQRTLGEHGIGAKSITTADGDYGQMLISCWPMSNTIIHDLSHPEREPRRAIASMIATPQGSLRLVATHLGLSVHERRGQTRKLLEIAGQAYPTVVAGDFNDWFWPGSVRSALSRELPGHTRFRTYPSAWPLLRLDGIYCRPHCAMLRSFTDREARHISDHLPVIADVQVQQP